MEFVAVTGQELQGAQPGIVLVEKVLDTDTAMGYLYGLTVKEGVLLDASSSIRQTDWSSSNNAEQPYLEEVALCIPFNSKTLASLLGSGLSTQGLEFAYRTDDEGPRTESIYNGTAMLTLHDFSEMAMSDTSIYVDDFLAQHGTLINATQVNRGDAATKQSKKASVKSLGGAYTDLTFSGSHGNAIDDYLK